MQVTSQGIISRSIFWLVVLFFVPLFAADAQTEKLEMQPFTAQVKRLIEALDYLGEPLSAAEKHTLEQLMERSDNSDAALAIQEVLDKHCLINVQISPESRVKVEQGRAATELVEGGWRVFLVKVRNEAGVTAQLKAQSPNALPVYARAKEFVGSPRPAQTIKRSDVVNRWLDLAMYDAQPLKAELSGLPLEYRIIQLYARDRGRREAQLSFNVGQGTQDIGFRNDVAVLFRSRPATEVVLRVFDEHNLPTTASFVIRDQQGRIYPARTKRLAPDFSFHPQIYRADNEAIRLPAGSYTIEYTRGPEYVLKRETHNIGSSAKPQTWSFHLERWIDPSKMNWYAGDHHIHAAGCMHYESPTQGVLPQDMIRHIKGEALGVGAVLTWGPCYYFQKQFFEAKTNELSTPQNLMRYDLEVSGFPSSHTGHLALLNLREQDYPGTKVIEDWPTWDLPILKWAKAQGATVGFAHSGWGLEVKSDQLPNYELPKFDGIGANEYIVDVTHDAVDFISAIDTPSVWELNIWYHTLNAGFRTRLSGETDFPCIYGERVGLGRSYVQLDKALDYETWVQGIRAGRAYVSDGKSHLLNFQINDLPVGTRDSEVKLEQAATVHVTAQAAALLSVEPNEKLRALRYDQQPYWDLERARIGQTRDVMVEAVVNGQPVASRRIVADGKLQNITFDLPIEHSSWVALRILPSSHTNPIFITVNNQPIRASRRSAEWCLKAVDQCWTQKAPKISARERAEAAQAYEHARAVYRRIINESRND